MRLLFQRGQFDRASTHLVSIALFWFAFSLPFGGLNLLLTRTFFAVQRPWIPTRLAAMNIVVDIVVSVALYKPLGIAGLVIGTVAANAVMTALQLRRLRAGFNGRLEGAQTTMITARIALASALLAGVSWVVWRLLRRSLGVSLAAQIVSVGGARPGGAVRVRARGAGDARAGGPPGAPPDRQPVRQGLGLRQHGRARRCRAGRAIGPPGAPTEIAAYFITSQDSCVCLGGVTLPTPGQAAGPRAGA